ncbi:GNAT family N-acetyltransferase [Flavobacterium sp. RHBU_24]|uniref:GNAT family N-acetyltransferase n=1 Tax=Flavobacterium sp. RHBU_24 TaxID=3391185 RepID=UPI003984C25C
MNFIPATTPEQLAEIQALAYEIMPEYYDGLMPTEHNLYFLEKYQTVSTLQQQLAAGAEYYFICTAQNYVKGYLALEPNTTEGHMLLSKLYLLKAHRGKGYGAGAMDFIIARSEALGLATLQLSVIQNNHGSIRFYERHGFTVTGEIIRSFETGHRIPNYIMERKG